MKKKITALVSVCALLVTGLLMTACGSAKYADSKYLGTWTATTAEYAGLEMNAQKLIGGDFTFTLTENGTLDLLIVDEKSSGNWEETEDGIKFVDSDEELELTSEKGKLICDYSDMKLTFEKK